jgi:hypothetical protein
MLASTKNSQTGNQSQINPSALIWISQSAASRLPNAPSQSRIAQLVKKGVLQKDGRARVRQDQVEAYIQMRDKGKQNSYLPIDEQKQPEMPPHIPIPSPVDIQPSTPIPPDTTNLATITDALDSSELQKQLLISRVQNEQLKASLADLQLKRSQGDLLDRQIVEAQAKNAAHAVLNALEAFAVNCPEKITVTLMESFGETEDIGIDNMNNQRNSIKQAITKTLQAEIIELRKQLARKTG